MSVKIEPIPRAFIWRRLHSLTGLWFVFFLIEHLITNSQAALLLGETGQGFVRAVKFIHNLPYLTVIEIGLLAVPILIHVIWGVKYALTSTPNSKKSDGSTPHLKYGRNRAYTWQRITAWLLIPLILMHVVKFRFVEYPETVNVGSTPSYFVKVSVDPGLYTVSDRLGTKLYNQRQIDELALQQEGEKSNVEQEKRIREQDSDVYSTQDESYLREAQRYEERTDYVNALTKMKLKPHQVVAASPTFGTASLLNVRDAFKNPYWVAFYTIFVLCACFHAFNGLWTSMITWGWIIRASAQTRARKIAIGLMFLIAFCGLIAVWGTYYLNLKH